MRVALNGSEYPKSSIESVRTLGGSRSRSWALALDDVVQGFKSWELWGALGWSEIRQRYRRSVLGPFWLTATQAITITAIGFLYGYLFKMPLKEYLPYLTAGMLVWGLISTNITDSCTIFTEKEPFIKQLSLPKTVFVLWMLWRNLLMFAHHFVIFIPVAIICQVPVGLSSIASLPGLLLVCVNSYWLALLLGMVCARFRDIPPLVTAMVQVAFFVTPVIWKTRGMSPVVNMVVHLNPMAYLLELVRAPLLGQPVSGRIYLLACIMTVVGCTITAMAFVRYRSRIAYWV